MYDEEARLRWQCRRGMLELDVLLSNFLDSGYKKLSAEKRKIFKKMLQYSDQELFHWFLKDMEPPNSEIADLVQDILSKE